MANTNILYHSVVPQNEKLNYSENEQVDFLIDFPGRKIVPGSIRLESIYNVFKTGTNQNDLSGLCLDPQAGAHCFIESITVETAQQGVIEVITSDYARYVKMKNQATKDSLGMYSANSNCEIISTDSRIANLKTQLKHNINDTNALDLSNDFSIKPLICVNNIQGGNLSYLKSGYVKLTFNLARAVQAFQGGGMADTAAVTADYQLSNLRIKFQSVPEDNNNPPLSLNTIYIVKQSITSSSANVSSKVPAVCSGFVGSFGLVNDENAAVSNGHKTHQPPGMSEIRVLFNDASNQLLTYNLRNPNDMIQKGRAAFGNLERNQCQNNNIGTLDGGFIVGASFDNLVNLTNNKINFQIDSGISADAYLVYLYFMGVFQL